MKPFCSHRRNPALPVLACLLAVAQALALVQDLALAKAKSHAHAHAHTKARIASPSAAAGDAATGARAPADAGSPGSGAATGTTVESPESLQAKAKLAQVRAQIAALVSRLGSELALRDAMNARLREAELGITNKRQRLESLHKEVQAAQRRRDALRAQEQSQQDALAGARAVLAGQVKAAYLMGRQDQIKMLLNQSDPQRLGRMATFYGYFGRERARQLAAIQSEVLGLQALGAEIGRQAADLASLEADGRRDLTDLERAREERALALAALRAQVKTGSEELAQLKREQQAVESLLAELSRVLQDFPSDTQQPFERMRGKLPWPVTGRLAARYQETRADVPQGSMRWNGILIETAKGAKVRAPYYGRVVYADWLQGLGLLMIIGHSGGYLSLYGHAEVLYKAVGDWVAPGDVIAGLSDADGALPELYFEIREGRRAVDPKSWLKTGP
jgi:septal ring factor EnvC (AmiA/AmiB activator)